MKRTYERGGGGIEHRIGGGLFRDIPIVGEVHG